MDARIIKAIKEIYIDADRAWRLRSEVVERIQDHFSLSGDESDLVIRHLLGEGYLHAVTVYRCVDDPHRLEALPGCRLGERLRSEARQVQLA